MFPKTCTRMFIHSSIVINRLISKQSIAQQKNGKINCGMSISEKLHSNESEQNIASYSNMDRAHKHYVDNMKPNAKGYMLCDSTYIMGKNGQN